MRASESDASDLYSVPSPLPHYLGVNLILPTLLTYKFDTRGESVYLDDIVYCEAMKNYTMIMLKDDKKLMPLIPLSKFETLLSETGNGFVQVHRSFLISVKHLMAVSSSSVTVGKFELPLGAQYKECFHSAIGMDTNR
ncbi:MAG: LytTR family transcriptional regulator [Sphingobacteriales bacterium]|nr:MAG: LytTR family transcriptional regulator [Sphingobacteriales bacterium]